MVCLCISCSGSGFCSNLLSFVISITFSFHSFGIVSPIWFCSGIDCKHLGLFYTCMDGSCYRGVPDNSMLTLAVIVLVSSGTILFLSCCIFCCSHFRHKTLTPGLALGLGAWFSIQEILTLAMIITISARYDRIGWSAFVFTLPGIINLGVVIFILVYMWCRPEDSVHPDI